MKIGILTFHYGYNFGGVLQAYATQQVLKGLGYDDVQIINCIANPISFATVGIPRQIDSMFFHKLWKRFRYGRQGMKPFLKFRQQYLNETPTICFKDIYEKTKSFDAIIVGSDQVWNVNSQKEGLYFFEWKGVFRGKKIAYAPCCGKNIVYDKKRQQTANALKAFDSLSVRNRETQSFVKSLTGIEPPIVPDPTCLYDLQEMVSKERPVDQPYIFVYQLGKDIQGGNAEAINLLKKKYPNRRIISSIIAHANPMDAPWADEIRYNLSPIDWINMIAHADMVFTDSFHGTLLSMRFKRPFITYLSEKERMARFVELKQQFGIEDNIVLSLDEISNFNPTSHSFDSIFESMKEEGVNYLKNALQV